MTELLTFLSRSYYDNTLWQLAICILFIIIGLVFKRLLSRLVSKVVFRMYKKHALDYTEADLHSLIKKAVRNFIMLIFVFIAFNQLSYPSILNLAPKDEFGIKMIIERGYIIAFIILLINISSKMVDFLGLIMIKKAEIKENKTEKQLIPFAIDSIKIILILFGIFIVLGSVFKINVGTLIAGLGIGGLAVALAAKETLENLMGSFTIFMDKPFVTGDMVKLGNTQGVVEKVGFRSTRLRTLDKTYVTVPNRNMVSSEVDNFTERTTRRVLFNIGLKYDSPTENMKKIITDIREYINSHPDISGEATVKFAEFDKSSLNIMVLYFINGNDFQLFLDTRENINFKIMEIVEQHGCGFAFPSTSVYMEK